MPRISSAGHGSPPPGVCEASRVDARNPDGGPQETEPPRPDLAEALERRALTRDEARPEAVEARHARGFRTARENVEDLVDPGSFVEYGRLAIAAQRARRELRELLERTPADGLVAGIGRVN